MNALFDLQRAADHRAVARWRAAHPGKERVWPDRADLVVWLMEMHVLWVAEVEEMLGRLNERIAGYNSLLGEPAWAPSRSHIETARNLMQEAADVLRGEP